MSEYIGRRIVPVHGGTWDSEKAYEELTIVLYEANGDSYISRRPVPAGTVIGDKNYWMLYSLYSQQIADAVKEMQETDAALRSELSNTENRMESRVSGAEKLTNQNKTELNTRMDGIDKRLDANVSASTDKNADYAAEVVDARVSADDTAYQNLGAHLRAIGKGTAIQALHAKKIVLPDLSMKKFYEIGLAQNTSAFEFSYEEEKDTLRIACVEDYPRDFILYASVLNAREYARLLKLEPSLLLKYQTSNVVNDGKAFKMSFYPAMTTGPEGTHGQIFSVTYTHTFQSGSENNADVASVMPSSVIYDAETECFLREGKPVCLMLLIYANSPSAGDEVTISGYGNLIYGLGANGLTGSFSRNMLWAGVESLKKGEESLKTRVTRNEEHIAELMERDYYNYRKIDFEPSGVFAPSDSVYEEVEDEYGDRSYRMTYVNNNPMYQMDITGYLPESCREVIVELTARRLSEDSLLRVQMYDRTNGVNHTTTGTRFSLTAGYRRYQFRISRDNVGNSTLGIGPGNTAGYSVQFKDVKILIPDERSKIVEQPLKHFHGYLGTVDFTKMEAVTLTDPVLCGTDDYAKEDGLYLDTIEIYSTKQCSIMFYIGAIDQYGLFQELSSFSAGVRAGRNLLKFDRSKILVPAGYGVFAQWTSDLAVYADPLDYDFHNLISSKSDYYENEQGYSGYPLRQTSYMVPMRYTLIEKSLPVKLDELGEAIETIREETSGISDRLSGVENRIISPDGVKYHLTVNADGSLGAISSIPKKVEVFGNSLTLGFGTFGMAASDSKHDYYYYVREFLLGCNPELSMNRHSASNWEGKTTSEERKTCVQGFLDSYTDGTEDLIIIQLSDNVNTDEKKATYAEDALTMLKMFRAACPKARIMWVASWYGWTTNYAPLEDACTKLGLDLIDIRDLSQVADNKNAIGNTYTKDDGSVVEITSAGVASHPGDTGMKLIADRIIERLKSYM